MISGRTYTAQRAPRFIAGSSLVHADIPHEASGYRIEGIIWTWEMTDLYHYGYLAQEVAQAVVAQENYEYAQTKLLSVFVGSI